MLTKDGALKIAAQRIGMSLRRYLSAIASGQKYCWRCKRMHKRSAFGRDSTRGDLLSPLCRRSSNKRQREKYEKKVPRLRPGPTRIARRDGDKKQARSRINHDVRLGLRPNPNGLPCSDCGHHGSDRRHEYDHHLGYAAKHHGDVQAVCTRCHANRERARRGVHSG